jgi:hypothetical protein
MATEARTCASRFRTPRSAPEPPPRGVYPIFPTPESADNPVSAHLDVTPTPFKLTYSVYLADVPPGGGALSVWPGSHRLLHGATATNASNLSDFETRKFCAAYGHLNQQTPRPGKAGTTVVMHYRLLHAASINRIPGHVRWALYFNQASSDASFATGKPSDNVWKGWEGIERIDAEWVRRAREPVGRSYYLSCGVGRCDVARARRAIGQPIRAPPVVIPLAIRRFVGFDQLSHREAWCGCRAKRGA